MKKLSVVGVYFIIIEHHLGKIMMEQKRYRRLVVEQLFDTSSKAQFRSATNLKSTK